MKTLPYLLGHVARPRPALSTYVHHYEWFEVGEQLQESRISLFPHFTTSLVFVFYHDVPILVAPVSQNETELLMCSLLPPLTRALQSSRIQQLRVFRVVFQPGALRCLYRINMKEIQNQLIDPKVVLDPSLAALHEQMWTHEDFEQCIWLFEGYLLDLLAEIARPEPTLFRQVSQILHTDSKATGVTQIADRLGVDRTTLAKRMKRELGFKTVQFLAVYRFCQVLTQMYRNPQVALVDLALDCGYNDQAYLSNDFRQMTGFSPGKYLRLLRSRRIPKLLDVSFSGLMVKG